MAKDWSGNYHSVCGCLGARNECKEEREEHDYYATQPIAAEWLVKIENLNKNIWECACGEGHLAKVFEKHGYQVKSTDLIDRGFGKGGVDFLQQTSVFDGDIVTNPPYNLHKSLLKKHLNLQCPETRFVCF